MTFKCKRCGHILTNPESIKNGYGNTCRRIVELSEKPEISNRDIEFLKIEINMLKREIRSLKVRSVDPIKRIQRVETPIINEIKEGFGLVVKELKSIFKDNFNYRDYLKPQVRETIEKTPNLYV